MSNGIADAPFIVEIAALDVGRIPVPGSDTTPAKLAELVHTRTVENYRLYSVTPVLVEQHPSVPNLTRVRLVLIFQRTDEAHRIGGRE